ncbi:MAG: hypothetical protein QXQ81_04465 [Candidatus Thorarchaeota archaeon]
MFILHLDEFKGFVVAKRYPSTFSLNERLLNLVYMEYTDTPGAGLKLCNVNDQRIATFTDESQPGWMVCFVLNYDEDIVNNSELLAGMSRLMLILARQAPGSMDVGEIIRRKAVIPAPSEEQICAKLLTISSSSLVLEKLQAEGAIRSRSLETWLRSSIQTDMIDLKEVVLPMMEGGIVKVEFVGRDEKANPPKQGVETVFLVKDIIGYRVPPVKALEYCKGIYPNIYPWYRGKVEEFFSGYNPIQEGTSPVSPVTEDRVRIASIVSDSLNYTVLRYLRERPMTTAELSSQTMIPGALLESKLYALEPARVVSFHETEKVWALISDPVFETFLPEYLLPLIVKKHAQGQIDSATVIRFFELLLEAWG